MCYWSVVKLITTFDSLPAGALSASHPHCAGGDGGLNLNRENKMKTTTTQRKIEAESNAARDWMLREHHGWTRLASNYGTRAEFDAECEREISKAADSGDDSPSMFDRAEFLDCQYYQPHFASLAPETTHIVAEGRSISQFTSEADAQSAFDEARREYGVNQLTCDRGGHDGQTERVDVSDIRVSVTTPSGRYCFDFASAEDEVNAELCDDKCVPESERESVIDAINAELSSLAAE